MNRRRGIVLMEILMAVTFSALLLVAAGRMIGNIKAAQKRASLRWEALLACRSMLEYSTAMDSGYDTVLVSGGNRIHVTTVRRIITEDQAGFVATASWSGSGQGPSQAIRLGRISLIARDRHSDTGR